MSHFCKTCGRAAPEAKFAKQSGSDRLRHVCNECRSKRDRAPITQKTAYPEPRIISSSWANLCADCRPDWGWNYRYAPQSHSKIGNDAP